LPPYYAPPDSPLFTAFCRPGQGLYAAKTGAGKMCRGEGAGKSRKGLASPNKDWGVKRPALRKAIKEQASISSPLYEQVSFSYLTSNVRKRFIQEWETSTTQRRAWYEGLRVFSAFSCPLLFM
jgi:hypothetical protein